MSESFVVEDRRAKAEELKRRLDKPKQMAEVLYRRVPTKDRLPEIEARYDTNHGLLMWYGGNWVHPDDRNLHYTTVEYWMEPIKEF